MLGTDVPMEQWPRAAVLGFAAVSMAGAALLVVSVLAAGEFLAKAIDQATKAVRAS